MKNKPKMITKQIVFVHQTLYRCWLLQSSVTPYQFVFTVIILYKAFLLSFLPIEWLLCVDFCLRGCVFLGDFTFVSICLLSYLCRIRGRDTNQRDSILSC